MPVSFCPANHTAKPVPFPFRQSLANATPASILQGACPNQHHTVAEMLQSSFVDQEDNSRIIPRKNGFVDTVVEAYNKHHALVVRPDDVWLAILTQFNFFVNGNADTLRSHFVAHEGKKHLVINAVGNRYMADFGAMARQMTALMQANIADPHLHKWIMPEFSTTTQTDTTVSAIVMMATMKTYFSYEFGLCCGIPRVTLEGERGD